MAAATEVGIRLSVSGDAQVRGALGNVERSMGQFGSAAQAAQAAVGPLMGLFSAGAALSKMVEVQRQFDVLNSSLKTVTGSSADAEREMRWIKQFAKDTPFGLAQATQGFVKMKSLGLDPSRAALTSFGNTASAMGKDLNQMIEAVADASTGEFERLKEFGIKAKKEGDQVSLTFQGVTKTIGNNAAEITGYLEAIGNNQFAGAMAERANTLDGAIASLGDTWDELFRTISAQNAGGLMHDAVRLAEGAVSDLTNIITALNGTTAENAQQTGAAATVQEGLATAFEAVAVLGANVKYTLFQIGNELGGLAAQAVAVATGQFAQAATIGKMMRADAEKARADVDATTARILGARQAAADASNRAAEINSAAATRLARQGAASWAAEAAKAESEAAKREAAAKKAADATGKDAKKAAEAELEWRRKTTLDLVKLWDDQAEAAQKSYDAARMGALKLADATEAAQAATTASLVDKLAAMRDEIDLIGLTTAQAAELNATKAEQVIADKEIELAMLRNADASVVQIQLLEQEINLRKQLVGAMRTKAGKEATVEAGKEATKAADEAQKAWQKASEDIEKSLTDALMRGFESGKGFFRNLADTAVNMFKTLVLRPTISAIVSPVAGAIVGGLGLSGAANAGTSALSAAGSAAGIANLFGGTGALATASGALSGFTTALTAGAQSLIGMTGTTAQMVTSLTAAGHVAAPGMAAGVSAGSAVSAAIPYVAVAALVANAIGLFRTTKTVGGGLTGTLGQGDINAYDLTRKSGTLFSGPDYKVVDKGVSAQSAALQTAFTAMRSSMAGMADTLGLGADAIKAFTTSIGNDVLHPDTGGKGLKLDGLTAEQAAAKVQEALAAANEEMAKTALASAHLTGWMARLAEGQTTALGTLQVLSAYPNQLLQLAGTSRDALVQAFAQGLMTGDATAAGQAVADQLVASIESTMVGNASAQIFDIVNLGIITPVLDAMLQGQSITEALSQASLDATIAAATAKAQALGAIFNDPKFVQAMDALQTGLGQVLGGVGGAIGFTPRYQATTAATVITPAAQAADSVGNAVADLAQKFADAQTSLLDTGTTLAVDLLRAQGNATGALGAERANYLAGFADLAQAERDRLASLYDQNQAVRDQITALEAAKTVATERQALERQLLDAQGNTAAIRALELAALEESNRPLQSRIWALEDEKAATEKLTASIASLVSAADSSASKYLSGRALTGYQYARAAENINALGFGNINATQLENATIGNIQAAVTEVVLLGNAAPEVKAQLMSLGASLIDLKQAAIDAAAATAQARADQLRGMQQEVATLSGDYATLVLLRQQEIDQMDGPLLQGMARYIDALKAQAAATAKEASRQQQQTGLQRQIAELSGDKVALAAFRELEIAQLDGPLNQSLQRYIYTLQDQKAALDDAAKGTDKAYSALERAVAAQRKTLETQHTAAQQLAQEVGSIFDTLKSNIRDLSGEVDSTQKFIGAAGQRYIAASLATARAGGGLPDGQDLADAIAASRAAIDVNNYATRSSFDRDKLSLIGQLSQLQSISGTQKSAAEQQVATAQAQLDALDQTLETAKTQIDTLRDIDNSVISVEVAVYKLALAVAAERMAAKAGASGAAGAAATGTTAGAVAAAAAAGVDLSAVSIGAASGVGVFLDAVANLPGKVSDQFVQEQVAVFEAIAAKNPVLTAEEAALKVYKDMLSYVPSGLLNDQVKQMIWANAGLSGVPEFALGGAFTNGIVSRPTMFDMAQMGEAGSEAIMPLANIGGSLGVRYAGPDFTHFGRGMEAMAAEITALRAELQGLRAEARATAVNTGRTQDLLKRVSRNGEALQTEAAT